MKSFEIFPYQGVGELRFGSLQTNTSLLLGDPTLIDHDEDEIREYRMENGFQTVYSKKTGALVEIGIGSNIHLVSFDGIRIFEEEPIAVLNHLFKFDSTPYESHGFIVLLEIGLTLTGFHDNDESQKAVTVFERGRWDIVKPRLKKFFFTIK